MNRTERLYAIVEQLRAVAPRPRSAAWLAAHFEVSVRTIERDVGALQRSGSAIYAEPGRTGGYCLDATMSLPPVNLTPQEAVAMTVALDRVEGTPFRSAAGSALRKLLSVMREDDVAAARALADRVRLLDPPGRADPPEPIPHPLQDAVASERVLRIRYTDRSGAGTTRDVEPIGFVGADGGWVLVAWCRLREGTRAFRIDRIAEVSVTAERVPPHDLDAVLDPPLGGLRRLPEA